MQYLASLSSTFLIKIFVATAILIATRLIINALSPVIREICQKNNLDKHSCVVLNKIMRYILNIFGVTIALQNLGVDVSMLIAAFGVTGIVLSYGMKDIVANFIASILILGYKTIKINDYIKIQNWEGTVIDINLRHTKIEKDNIIAFVPNIVIYSNVVGIVQNRTK